MFNVFFGNIYFWLWVPGEAVETGDGDVTVLFCLVL